MMDHDHHQQSSSAVKTKKEVVCVGAFLVTLVSSIFVLNFASPFDDWQLSRFGSSSREEQHCDYAYGRWIREENKNKIQHGYDENCPFLDPGFRCRRSGRSNFEFLNWKWHPYACSLPRFNASDLLERSRNGRIVFAGDSIVRNQWESFICMLGQGVSNKSTIYEVHGKPITKHKGFLSMRFSLYNLTVEYYRVPFLVVVGHPPPNSTVKMTVKVDTLHWFSKKWVGADVLVFSGGHWWNEDKTFKLGCYFEDGGKLNMSMNLMDAFQRSIETWKTWAISNLDPIKSHVFFRSFSPVHYRNGTWNDGGRCDTETQPETNYTELKPEPQNNELISNIINQMKSVYMKVHYLNITYLTELRSDGHPSMYREPGTRMPAPQDCSHWCLPGIPDVWNEILYAELLSMGFRTK